MCEESCVYARDGEEAACVGVQWLAVFIVEFEDLSLILADENFCHWTLCIC
jgi:hypothetical protein